MHISQIWYVADIVGLVLCAHFKKDFFFMNFSSNRMKIGSVVLEKIVFEARPIIYDLDMLMTCHYVCI